MTAGQTQRPTRKAATQARPALAASTPVDAAQAPRVLVGWQQAITDAVQGLGYDLVDIERAQRGLLRVTIDRLPGKGYSVDPDSEFVTVQDCEKVTRQLQFALEVENLDYARLEVSSPGLDRPLKREADYVRFAGQAIALVLKQPFKGRKNWQGMLSLVPAQAQAEPAAPGFTLLVKDGKTEQELGFTLNEVREARLVPVVNFKGRKAGDGAGHGKAAAPTKQDGG